MIRFLDSNFSALNHYLQQAPPTRIYILVDEHTHENCLPVLLANLETTIPFEVIEIEAGEENKNIQTATQLWEILSEFHADRHSLMLNLGGGVITDLGGFIASTYKRGIKFINLPTSLLAMVDASIGGKTGINHQFYKNMIGTFTFPEKIFIFPEFLKTLAWEELRSGFAEMLKHGLIYSQKHWEDLRNLELNPQAISPYVEDSMKIKEAIVEQDFKEQNLRKTLNFGHTLGHAIESLFLQNGNPIRHGEAIAAGMMMESHISYSLQYLHEEDLKEITESINRIFPLLDLSTLSFEDIFSVMLNDKKNSNGKIKFSLLQNIGKGIYDIEVSSDFIKEAIDYYKNLNQF